MSSRYGIFRVAGSNLTAMLWDLQFLHGLLFMMLGFKLMLFSDALTHFLLRLTYRRKSRAAKQLT